MEINKIQCLVKTLRLREPYSTSYESVERFDNIFMNISTIDGYHGWGVAAPVKSITGESSQDVQDSFNNTIEPFLKGEDVFRYAFILEFLKKELPGKPAALAMVDMALHDILSQKTGIPLYKLLGSFRTSIPTSITIGIMPINTSLAYAKSHVKRGFKILKIKGGKNVSEDIEKINKIRETVGKQIKLRFDANQGYSVEDSLKFIKDTKDAGIELLEQPTPKVQLDQLAQVTRKASVPVMADESLLSLKDAFRRLCDVMGVDPPRRMVGRWAMYAAGVIKSLQGALTRRNPGFSYGVARVTATDWFYNPAKARREIGLPQTPLEAAATEAWQWFKETNCV